MTVTDLPQLWDDIDGPRVRESDPVTSHAAADSNTKEHRSAVEAGVLEILASETCTDEVLTKFYFSQRYFYGWPDTHPDSVRKRRSDLTNRGLVEDSGLVGVTKSGRKAVKWTTVK